MPSRITINTIIPIACTLAALVLVCLTIFGGFNSNLRFVHWIKTTIHPSLTRSPFNLPSWTSTHLFTECATYPSGRITCSKPTFGVRFNPARDDLPGSPALADALTGYANASRWMAGGYIFSAVSLLLIPLEGLFFWRALAAFSAGLAAVVVAASTVIGAVFGARAVEEFNAVFKAGGVKAALGIVPIVFGGAAAVLALVVCGLYVAAHRANARSAYARSDFGGDDDDDEEEEEEIKPARGSGTEEYHSAPAVEAAQRRFSRLSVGGGLSRSALSPARHKYVQIEEQQERVPQWQQQERMWQQQVREMLNPSRRALPEGYNSARLDLDADVTGQRGDARPWPGTVSPPESSRLRSQPPRLEIRKSALSPLVVPIIRPTRDMNTVYEPYRPPQRR
ncbi:hypothetical protein VTJ04DRAFT_5162 [Mycothermus thermophilus]|uniref:uncharacterized protein n=1 Tax=Humicola insolens TaxID=85995 RepID=UPI003743B9CE